jgi:hypothetical protein
MGRPDERCGTAGVHCGLKNLSDMRRFKISLRLPQGGFT